MSERSYRRADIPWLETPEGEVLACPEGAVAPLHLSEAGAVLWDLCTDPCTVSEAVAAMAAAGAGSSPELRTHMEARMEELADAGVLLRGHAGEATTPGAGAQDACD